MTISATDPMQNPLNNGLANKRMPQTRRGSAAASRPLVEARLTGERAVLSRPEATA